jgi:hypothetical protein
MIVTTIGTIANGCDRFDEFGCGGYLLMGVYAVPIGAISGGLAGGICTVVMRGRQGGGGTKIWRNGLLLACVSGLLSASGLILFTG